MSAVLACGNIIGGKISECASITVAQNRSPYRNYRSQDFEIDHVTLRNFLLALLKYEVRTVTAIAMKRILLLGFGIKLVWLGHCAASRDQINLPVDSLY
jgi:hypothetical protein